MSTREDLKEIADILGYLREYVVDQTNTKKQKLVRHANEDDNLRVIKIRLSHLRNALGVKREDIQGTEKN